MIECPLAYVITYMFPEHAVYYVVHGRLPIIITAYSLSYLKNERSYTDFPEYFLLSSCGFQLDNNKDNNKTRIKYD